MDDGQGIGPGDRAPDFAVQWIERDGTVSLSDYGETSLLLTLVRGLWCPFCRRAIAQVGSVRDRLRERRIETLAIVAAEPDNARIYLRYRPSRVPLAADPAMATHGAYGLPRPDPTPELFAAVAAVRSDAAGELPEPLPFEEASAVLNRIDGYEHTAGDEADMERGMTQLTGHFLIDRDRVVRWTDIECARDGLAGLGRFPGADELLEAAKLLA